MVYKTRALGCSWANVDRHTLAKIAIVVLYGGALVVGTVLWLRCHAL